jgi:hypothetical protein
LFKEVIIEDPSDCSDNEHYQKKYKYIAQVCCSERLTSRTHPSAASMNILSIAEVSCLERLASRSHQTAASINIIRASGFKK